MEECYAFMIRGVLMLLPEHLLLASSGIRLLLARGGLLVVLPIGVQRQFSGSYPQKSCCHCISPSETLPAGSD